jgi:hypothetical protein
MGGGGRGACFGWLALPVAQGKVGGWGSGACCLRCLDCTCWRLRCVGGSALARELVAMLGRWQRHVGIGKLLTQAADALASSPCLRPRVMVEGGQWSSLFSAHITDGTGQKWRGGRGTCFACVTWLALISNGRVLGLVHWQGMLEHQRWRVGGAMALSQFWRQHAGVRGGGTQQST